MRYYLPRLFHHPPAGCALADAEPPPAATAARAGGAPPAPRRAASTTAGTGSSIEVESIGSYPAITSCSRSCQPRIVARIRAAISAFE
jgi:hypothetical protein